MPEDFLPEEEWIRTGLSTATFTFALDPEDASRQPEAPVQRACWRLEQLGCAGLLRGALEAIQDDATLDDAARCQATRAIASIGDVAAAVKLLDAAGDPILGPQALLSLSRMGPTALRGIRRAGLPVEASARSRVSWLFGRYPDDLTSSEIGWLARELAGEQHKEALWALVRLHACRPTAVVHYLRPLLSRPTPVPSAWAVLGCARVRDASIEPIAILMAREGTDAPRQLALQYLGRVETPDAVDILVDVLSDPSAPPGDRAAAVLGLSSHRAGRARGFAHLAPLLGSDNVKLVRAALSFLSEAPDAPAELIAQAKELASSSDPDVQFFARMLGRPK